MTVLSDRQWALLQFLYATRTATPAGSSIAVSFSTIRSGIAAGPSEAGNLIAALNKSGLVAVDHLNAIRISPAGVRMVEEEKRLSQQPRKWLERDRALGYRLGSPRPNTIDGIRDALGEAAEIMNTTQGPGAPAYEQARTISDLLKQDLQILLSRQPFDERQSITVHGGVHGSTLQQAGRNAAAEPPTSKLWTIATTVVATVVATLILYYVFGIG